MINVLRGSKPESLESDAIKLYLDDIIHYNSLDSADKKNATKPDAGTYRNSDLLEAFDRDFYSKCYLTEQKFANSYSMDIEHFKSKSIYPELKYEWTNLYPCSHDANMFKPRNEPNGGYLDPCNEADDVENEIVYTLELGDNASFDALVESNIKAKNTAHLLNKIHNGDNYDSEKKTAQLRLLIQKKSDEVKELIMDWLNPITVGADKIRAEKKLKNLLSRKSDFTMLLRSMSCVKKHIPVSFLD